MAKIQLSRQGFAKRVNQYFSDTLTAILKVGQVLIEAKAALPHGEFTAMVEEDLPFGARTTQRLMAIASDERLSNPTHGSLLPPSWRTLYELTKLTDEQWQAGIESTVIQPDMQRKDVITLRKEGDSWGTLPAVKGGIIKDLHDLVSQGKTFGTLYIDPPWPYQNQSTRAATSNHYDILSIDDIAALPLSDLAAEKSHLHLWTTNAFLVDAIELLAGWGFEFKSTFVWAKSQLGIGNYWRCSHEIMLLGVKGKLTFPPTNIPSWLEEPRTKHSSKPDTIRALIEQVSPPPRIEFFARQMCPGWIAWGNEIEETLLSQVEQ